MRCPKKNGLNNDHGNYVFATFTGHIYDTILDIYFAEARFYDANNRTWLAMDPVKDGGNWYQYCYSNPTTYYDPTGLAGFSHFSGCVDVNKLAEQMQSGFRDWKGKLAEFADNIDWARVGVGALKAAGTALVTLGTVVAGTAAFAFGAADMMEAFQDLRYGMWGSSKTSINPLRDTLFAGNGDLYYGMEMLTTLLASAGTAIFRSFNMESEIDASKMAGYGKGVNFGSGTPNAFGAPEITTNKKGELTNGTYTLNQKDMLIHVDGKNPNKSQFLYDVDANKAVLDASAYADANNLWVASTGNSIDFANKAKVPVTNGYVGVTGKGELTSYINVYRTKTGYVHGCPGNP